jgi:hypothetical protein
VGKALRLLALIALPVTLVSCGTGGGVDGEQPRATPEKEPQVSAEAERLLLERLIAMKKVLAGGQGRATPVMDLNSLKIAENRQKESAPYAGREEKTERPEELELVELIRRFGAAYRRAERVISKGDPLDWPKLAAGGSCAETLSIASQAMLTAETRSGSKRGQEFTNNLTLLARNSERVWKNSREHAAGLVVEDFGNLGKCCAYFPREIADGLRGVGISLPEDSLPAATGGQTPQGSDAAGATGPSASGGGAAPAHAESGGEKPSK